jgi:hypothetical protein
LLAMTLQLESDRLVPARSPVKEAKKATVPTEPTVM